MKFLLTTSGVTRFLLGCAAVFLAFSLSASAEAASSSASPPIEEASAENKAAAREIATEAIYLAQANNCSQALPRLVRAQSLYRAPTILLWIGKCQVQLGRLVEGSETLHEVTREKLGENAPKPYIVASREAQSLLKEVRPRIARLIISVTPEIGPDLGIEIDGQKVASAFVDAARPTDPGVHQIVASAPGYLSERKTVELAEGQRLSLAFSLVAEPNSERGGPSDGPPISSGRPEPGEVQDMAADRNHPLAWPAAAVGGVLVAVGGVTGILAIRKKGQLDESCPTPRSCPASQADTLKAAKTHAALSTTFLAIGGAALVTSILLFATGKKTPAAHSTSHFHLTPRLGWSSLEVVGRF